MKPRLLPVLAIGAAVVAVGLAIAAWYRVRGAGAGGGAGRDWAPAWTAMRACVLGDPPASGDRAEAIAAADLIAPKRTCAHELVALGRALGDGGGWTEVDRALAAFADAFADHARTGFGRDPDAIDPLPAALGRLETAVAAVRPDVKAVAPARPALPAVTATPLLVDGEPVVYQSVWRNTLYGQRGTSEAPYEIRWVAGAPLPLPLPLDGSDSTWSPAGTWQVWVDAAGSRSKVMMATDTAANVTQVATGPAYQRVIAAIGEDTNRLIVYRDDRHTWLARSVDDGQAWSRVKLPIESAVVSSGISAAGDRLDLIWWQDGTRRLSLRPAENAAGALPPFATVSEADTWTECSGGALWLALHEGEQYVLRRADAPAEIARFKTEPLLEACSADKVVLRTDDEELACDATTCKALAKLDAFTTSKVVGGDVVREAEDEDVIAVWWSDRPPALAKLPHGRMVRGVIDAGGGHGVLVLTMNDRVEYADLPK